MNAVRLPLTLWHAINREPHAAALSYRACDPYAVELASAGHARPNVLFSRALLIDGLEGPAGEGQVRISPHDADDYIALTLPVNGHPTEFYAEREQLETFVDRTYEVVHLGREDRHLNLDDLIARLLQVSK